MYVLKNEHISPCCCNDIYNFLYYCRPVSGIIYFMGLIALKKYMSAVFPMLFFILSGVSHASLDAGITGRSVSGYTDKEKIEKAVEFIDVFLYREAEEMLLDVIKGDSSHKEKAYFLIGRLYKEQGDFQKAAEYLQKAVDNYHLLEDHALKMLMDVYVVSEQFDRALITVKKIRNSLFLRDAGKVEITALLAMKKEDEAIERLSLYVRKYPGDRDYKFNLAILLKDRGNRDRAVKLFKDIYVNASSLAGDAFAELKALKAGALTKEETIERADNLFRRYDYVNAEAAYKSVIEKCGDKKKADIIYKIAMCQFRQKRYADSAKTFGMLGGAEAMYWKARSYYRIDDMEGFESTKKKFEKKYPRSKNLALVFLMEAEEAGRQGDLELAEKSYKKVLAGFPGSAEKALWGLGWVYYVSGDYKNAHRYLSKLTSYVESRDYYKYIYWMARARENLAADCAAQGTAPADRSGGVACRYDDNYFSGLPSDESYYGHLIKQRFPMPDSPEKMEPARPERPEGEAFEKIEALASLGMREWAMDEIVYLLRRTRDRDEILYLEYTAMEMEAYKEVIAFAEAKKAREFLPYSYPLAYWKIINRVADFNNLDAHLVAALIREESRFDPMVISWAGAFGLMQLMPSTAERLKIEAGVKLTDVYELHDAEKNIRLGTHYLSQLVDEFKELPLAIAAYNAGENILREWTMRFDQSDIIEFIENIPYRETRRYVKKVLKSYWQYRIINGLPVRGIEKNVLNLTSKREG